MKGGHDGAVTDKQIEVIVGLLLRTGVLIAGIVVLLGGVVYLAHHWSAHPDYRTFVGTAGELRRLDTIVRGALQLRGQFIIQLGLVLLIATPIARVIFSAAAFFMERDYLYVLMTLLVFATLMYSLFGHAG